MFIVLHSPIEAYAPTSMHESTYLMDEPHKNPQQPPRPYVHNRMLAPVKNFHFAREKNTVAPIRLLKQTWFRFVYIYTNIKYTFVVSK